ncbi:hypothetical protein [Cognatitamlana onchidii]|uniref:hypothetical protein n=1 Tax=Cognatitamlana onchidii TaxID=2562860 RepID=UPI0010A63B72|nr:hypothetical protein [Algibacter onchidii]
MDINNWITFWRGVAIVASVIGLIGLIGLAITTRKAAKISNERIIELESSKLSLIQEKEELETLKKTAPEVEIIGLLIKNGELKIIYETLNKVPIRFKSSIVDEKNRVISNSVQTESAETYPTKEPQRFNIPYNSIQQIVRTNFIPMDKDVKVKVNFYYHSIYYPENGLVDLKRSTSQIFMANFKNETFEKITN